jgi:hypothetical protein
MTPAPKFGVHHAWRHNPLTWLRRWACEGGCASARSL